MESEASLPAPLDRWVDALRDRGLTDLADLFIRLLPVWGFVAGQILWMVAPLLKDSLREGTLVPLAQALEDPLERDGLATCTTKAADISTGANG